MRPNINITHYKLDQATRSIDIELSVFRENRTQIFTVSSKPIDVGIEKMPLLYNLFQLYFEQHCLPPIDVTYLNYSYQQYRYWTPNKVHGSLEAFKYFLLSQEGMNKEVADSIYSTIEKDIIKNITITFDGRTISSDDFYNSVFKEQTITKDTALNHYVYSPVFFLMWTLLPYSFCLNQVYQDMLYFLKNISEDWKEIFEIYQKSTNIEKT